MDNGQLTTEEREAATPDWKKKVKAAHDMVHALCQPRGSEGSRRWVMSIPAREDYDPDLVITSGLMAAEKEIAALTADRDSETRWACQYKAERDEVQRRLDALLAMLEESADSECYCEDDDCHPIEVCERHTLYRRARAIAEGRDNG